jgi:hypothetical protein
MGLNLKHFGNFEIYILIIITDNHTMSNLLSLLTKEERAKAVTQQAASE